MEKFETMMCTYLTASERQRMSSVLDKDLDELFQSVRRVTGDNFWIGEKDVFGKRNWLGRIRSVETLYILYASAIHNETGDILEVQVINFPPQNNKQGSINVYVSKGMAMTYLFGTLNGLHVAKHQK